MTPAAGSPGTASDGYRVDPPTGRHRAPPTVPTPRAPTVIAVAAAVLAAASLGAIAGAAVAPDATARSQVSTVTRAERTDAGPLVLPTVGVSGAWEPPEETTKNALNRPRSVPGVQGHAPTPLSASTGQPEVLTTPPQQTVTPAPQPVTDEQAQPTPTTPLADPIAAADSATPTPEETPAVTPEPTVTPVTVDVTAEVGTP